LPFGDKQVYLQVNRRQIRCDGCGSKFSEELEFVKKKRIYTERFKNKIIEEVLESDIKNVARRNGVSEQEVETMLKELAAGFIEEKPQELKKLGIDEIAVVKGQKNYYVVLVDLEKRALVGMVEKRTTAEVEQYVSSWGEEVLSQIEEVSIDLWKPYKKVIEKLMPQAEIVADRFHVMKQVNKELDTKRKKIKKEVEKVKDKTEREKMLLALKKSRYVLLKNEEDLKESEKEKLELIRDMLPELARPHRLKEEFRNIFEKSKDWVEGLFNLSDWLREAQNYFADSCGTIKRWLGEIIAYFDQRTTQGVVEGINNKLKLIKRRGYGFRNFNNFKLRSFLTWHFAS
ncbi:ISL3 family transposase, partial [Trichocoleus sp. FACHB-90]|uniref:ISL3 family transposase n=2 Tax=Bacteria TaxID=2 RepID=UPI001687D320